MEIGYITINSERDQGVIWTRFILRNVINNGPSDTDVTITLGKVEAFMLKRIFRFSQASAFIGLGGKTTRIGKLPIT